MVQRRDALLMLLIVLMLTACSDNGNSLQAPTAEGSIEEITSSEPLEPLAKLGVGLRDSIGDLTVVALDATDSRYDPAGMLYKYTVREKMAKRTVRLAGPGQILKNYVNVLLPAGTYEVMLTVMNSKSEVASVIETITVQGPAVQDWRPTNVEWSLDAYYQAGDATEIYSRSIGPAALGLLYSVYQNSGSVQSSGVPVGGGCGGMLNNAGNGIKTVTGVIGVGAALAAIELKVAAVGVKKGVGTTAAAASAVGASTKIAGGNTSGACMQAQINAISDQLHFQEEQILKLYALIDRDEQVFFKTLVDEANAIQAIENVQFNDALEKFTGAVTPFMQAAALWDENGEIWKDSNNNVIELDLLKIAASDYDDARCTVNVAGCNADPSTLQFLGPISFIDGVLPLFNYTDLQKVAGLKDKWEYCTYDCWQHVGPTTAGASNELLDLYKSYAEQLYAQVTLCTALDPDLRSQCITPQNNVVPLFDQYNTAISMMYLKAVNALQKSHTIYQLMNLYNYNRYVAAQCSIRAEGDLTQSCIDIQTETNAGSAQVSLKQIDKGNGIPGAFFKHSGLICDGTEGIASTPEENAKAFTCAQQQLNLLFGQMFNVLYTNTLNFMLTDGPVGPQSYPTAAVTFPPNLNGLAELNAALQAFNQDLTGATTGINGGSIPLGPTFDYAYEVGRALPATMGGARTPKGLVTQVAGLHTSLNGSNWTTDGALYQAYHISDAATCIQTLIDYNASGESDTTVASIYPNYDSCPSIFALHDKTAVINGVYNGIRLTPYSYQVSPGGDETCPAACNSCPSGLDLEDPNSVANWIPGGQGLLPYTDPNDTGSWQGQCDNPVFSGRLGDASDPPTLEVTGCDPTRQFFLRTSTTCESGRWGNNNGSLFCEPAGEVTKKMCRGFCSGSTSNEVPDNTCGDYDFADEGSTDCTQCSAEPNVGVLALSAPEAGNIRQCQVAKAVDEFPAVYEGDTITCGTDIYYAQRYANSLAGAEGPGSGPEASFQDVFESGAYRVAPSPYISPAPNWDIATGDNGSWSGSCENSVFSGDLTYVSPPKLEASCRNSLNELIRSSAECDSARWGNREGQLFCEVGGEGRQISAPGGEYVCSNETFGDPFPGYYKQCFCPGGNSLEWLRPDTTGDADRLPSELTSLSCGNLLPLDYQVSAGADHTCALDDTGVQCWGSNLSDQTTVPALSNPVQVSAGYYHTCALDDTGVQCWGLNTSGRTTVPALSNPVQVNAGGGHTCAIDDTGVQCWGRNDYGQTTVPALSNPVQVSAGDIHTCALDDTGVQCWGRNKNRQTIVPALSNPVQVSAGYEHTCALDDTGVQCWGNDEKGQSTVPPLSNPVQLEAGENHTCALDDTGVQCWGAGKLYSQSTVPALSNPVQVSAGRFHTCALDNTGVQCWGWNDYGQTTVPDLLFDFDRYFDSDLDGVEDNGDAFPLDAEEQVDSDGDGVGDNGDAFPLDPNRQ